MAGVMAAHARVKRIAWRKSDTPQRLIFGAPANRAPLTCRGCRGHSDLHSSACPAESTARAAIRGASSLQASQTGTLCQARAAHVLGHQNRIALKLPKWVRSRAGLALQLDTEHLVLSADSKSRQHSKYPGWYFEYYVGTPTLVGRRRQQPRKPQRAFAREDTHERPIRSRCAMHLQHGS